MIDKDELAATLRELMDPAAISMRALLQAESAQRAVDDLVDLAEAIRRPPAVPPQWAIVDGVAVDLTEGDEA